MPRNPLDKKFSKKIDEINERIKNSFSFIREDLEDMDQKIGAMGKYLKNQKKTWDKAKSEEDIIREELRRDVDEFTQKITQLKLALSEMRAIRNEVVITRDLAKIEDRIKTSFKREIEDYKKKVESQKEKLKDIEKRTKSLEKGITKKDKPKKKGWFG